jgi:hypothetical protein
VGQFDCGNAFSLVSECRRRIFGKSAEATMMASKPHRLFDILWRLRHPSSQFLYEFKEMFFMLTYLAAVLGLFWLMGKISTHVPWPKVI